MAEPSEEELFDALEGQIRRFGLISQTKIDVEDVDSSLNKEELLGITDRILEEDDIPEPAEERLSYLSSVLRVMMEDGFETGLSTIGGMMEASLASLGSELLVHEDLERYEAVIDMVDDFNEEQLDLAFNYITEFRDSDEGVALTQNHVHLSEMSDPISEIEVVDPESAQNAIDIYSKCMDVCDNASTILLAVKRIDESGNPLEVNLSGMNFGAKLNELSDSNCEKLVDGIDKNLRNALSHGDLVVEPYEEEVYDASTKKTWSYKEFERETKTCASVSKFMASLPVLIVARWTRTQEM